MLPIFAVAASGPLAQLAEGALLGISAYLTIRER